MAKLPSLPRLKKKLWTLFSEYIRKREIDAWGYAKCISCGKHAPWTDLHAGHYIPKSVGLSIYFHEKNVHPQCVGCNMFRHGNLSSYAIALRQKYGEGILEELEQIKNTPLKLSRVEYMELIEKYKALIK